MVQRLVERRGFLRLLVGAAGLAMTMGLPKRSAVAICECFNIDYVSKTIRWIGPAGAGVTFDELYTYLMKRFDEDMNHWGNS